MNEYTINLHMHTPYSDGTGTHKEIAQAAMEAGIDAVIVTDHNVWVSGLEGYYQDQGKRVLVLIGEEVHDQARDPQKNHLLVFNTNRELAPFAKDPQRLINAVKESGGLSFLAHPVDPAAPAVGEGDLSWVSWGVHGYTGIELWNAFSEFKVHIKTKLHAIYYAYNFKRIAHGPLPEALKLWDHLLKKGERVVAVAGSDAHALHASLGPLHRVLFPYEDHFKAVNTHIFTPTPLTGNLDDDKSLIYDALRNGHIFIGYDLPFSTKGFRFTGQGKNTKALMGDEISGENGVTLQIHLPLTTECQLLKDGEVIEKWSHHENHTHIATEKGVYRVEAFINYLGKRRGWIFSNPIYIR
ncbi:MAG: CehA/McbA family metallohydrolase [Anaerolineales bacterium]|nr:CehA/McbA family metallohydrolase [Anaerolineales bacterium]